MIGCCLFDLEWLQAFQYLTSDDLWPKPKSIGTIYLLWMIHHPSMVIIGRCVIDLEWLQGFQYLTSVDLRWPLTWTKNNRDHLLTMGDPTSEYENDRPLRLWLRVVTSFSVFYLRWPLTGPKNNRDHLLTMDDPPSKYGNHRPLRHWLRVVTRFSVFDLCWPQMTFDLNQKQ